MNIKTKHILSLFLAIFIAFCLGGCASTGNNGTNGLTLGNEKVQLVNEKVVELINYDIAHDSEGA